MKNFMNYKFFLSDFSNQNVLILPSPKIPQGAKCANTPRLYTAANHLLKNSVLENRGYIWKMQIQEISIKNWVYNYYFDNLVKTKKLKTKNILINEKNYNDLVIYFTIYFHSKAIKMLSPYYYELMEKVKENEEKYLVIDHYVLDKVWIRLKQ